MSAAPPRAPTPMSTASMAQALGAGSSSASSTNGGEKIIDCGSAIWGWPENTNGVQNGHSPAAMLWARNWIWGRKCALASQGIVTRPDSQGHPMTTDASTNTTSGGSSDHGAGGADADGAVRKRLS